MIVDMSFSASYRPAERWYNDGDRIKLQRGNQGVVDYMRAMPPETRFVYILGAGQHTLFDKWVEEFKLKDLIVFRLPQLISNQVHIERGRSIDVIVMSRTPLTKEERGNIDI